MGPPSRCPACDTKRVAAFRYCRSCGYDFEPNQTPIWPEILALPPTAPPAAPAATPAAPEVVPKTIVARAEAAASPETDSGSGIATGLRRGATAILGFLRSLDPTERRSLLRLTGEIAVLVALVVVAGIITPRGGTAAPAQPPVGGIGGPTIGLKAADAIETFGLARLGGFTFTSSPTSSGARLVGKPVDGWATLELRGDPEDLRAIVMTVQTYGAGELDRRQRRHLSAFLTVYAPDEVEHMLASLDTALANPEDTTVKVGTASVEVRLETEHVSSNTIAVRLILAPPENAQR